MLENQLIANRYQVQRLLAHGGNAWVYRVLDKQSGELRALRYLRFANEAAEWAFQRELRLVARLEHPHIISYLDTGSYQRGHFVTMPLLQETVAQRYLQPASSALEVKARLETVMPLVDALEYLHQQHIVHADIKASNILFSPEGAPILCDFGVAHDYSLPRLKAVALQITPSHVSPEAAQRQRLTPASDLYSLGCFFYEVLTGTPPFGTGNQPEIIVRHLKELPPAAHERNPHISTALSDIFLRLLAKAPEARYGSMADLRHDLQQALTAPSTQSAAMENMEKDVTVDVEQVSDNLSPSTLQSMQAASLLLEGIALNELSQMLQASEQSIFLDMQVLLDKGIVEKVAGRYRFVEESLRQKVEQGVSSRRHKRYLARLEDE